ncbi:MAG: TolC family protein [Bacteroidales bacterium]|nr:TolC family protein [Bacteroidales bacterium]
MKKIISIIIFFSTVYLSYAQDTIVLNFQDAIKMAIEKNTSLKQQENILKITKATKLQSEAAYLPNLNFSSFGNITRGQQLNSLKEIVNTSDNLGYTFASNYTLFDGFNRLNTLLQSVCQNKAQLNQIEQTKQNTIFNTAAQYLQVLLDEELIKITSENLAAQRINYERVKGFVESNITAITDLYTLEAQINQIEVQLLSNKSKLFSDKATLATTLMLEPGMKFKLSIPNWGIEKTILEDIKLDSLLELAKSNRPDLKQLELANKASLYNIRIAKSGIYPNLGFFYNYNSSYTNLSQSPFKKQLLNENPTHVIGFNLSIPIFNRLQYRTSIVNAKVNYENTLLNYDNYQNVIYAQITTAYNNFLTNKETYNANIVGYAAAKLSFEKQSERFRLGIGTIVELSLANQNYVQAQSSKAQAEYTLLFQKIIIDFYTGTLNVNELYYK